MIDLGPHAAFIIWSYLGAALVIALLVFWTAYSSKTQKKRLEALEQRGITRRSAASASAPKEK